MQDICKYCKSINIVQESITFQPTKSNTSFNGKTIDVIKCLNCCKVYKID